MASSNNRDVRLGIEIETAGEVEVKRLADAVRSLGKEGDPAALEYRRLGDELDRLSQQAGAIQTLQTLRGDVEKLSVAERTTAEAASAAAAAYREQATAAAALREAQANARTEVAEARKAYNELDAALKTLKNNGAEAGQSQIAFAAQVREAKQQLIDQQLALRTRNADLRVATTLANEATAAENKLAAAALSTGDAAARTATALGQQSAALTEAEAAALGLGLQTDKLDEAQKSLLASTQAYVTEAAAKRAAVAREIADADRQAAIEAYAYAEAQKDLAVETASELAAIKESLAFVKQYTTARAAAATETQRLADAEQRRVAALIEQNAADLEAFNLANGLAEARERGRACRDPRLDQVHRAVGAGAARRRRGRAGGRRR